MPQQAQTNAKSISIDSAESKNRTEPRKNIYPIKSSVPEYDVDALDLSNSPNNAKVMESAHKQGLSVKLIAVRRKSDGGLQPEFQVMRTGVNGNSPEQPVGQPFKINRDDKNYLNTRDTAIVENLKKHIIDPGVKNRLDVLIFPNNWSEHLTKVRANGFAENILKNANRIDLDRNGRISKNELVQAAESSEFQSDDAKNLAVAYLHQKDIENVNQDKGEGISALDLVRFDQEVGTRNNQKNNSPAPKQEDLILRMQKTLDRASRAVNSTACFDLFAHPDNPIQDISPDAVCQGSYGNCYLMAPLASVAHTCPKLIVQMIKQNKDGTLTVTFPGDPKNPITIKQPSKTEMAIFNSANNFGTWAGVIEKAYGKYCNPRGKNLPAEGAPEGGDPIKVLELLTGRKGVTTPFATNFFFHKVSIKTDQSVVIKALQTALKEKKAITAASNEAQSEYVTDRIPRNHAFSVMDFNPKGPNGGTITLRDPGDSNPENLGFYKNRIEISLETFIKFFHCIQAA